jgi:hypothetical protein
MNREKFKEELMIRRRRKYLSTLTPLGRAVLRGKILMAKMLEEERGCKELQQAK